MTRFFQHKLSFRAFFLCCIVPLSALAQNPNGTASAPATHPDDQMLFPGETHLKNIRQITFGGNNAEAYWSFDNKRLIFQSEWTALTQRGCDQIFTVDVTRDSLEYKRISLDRGRTTCAYFLPDGRMIFSSTHAGGHSCPVPQPVDSKLYVWPIFNSYDIYIASPDGSNIKELIRSKFYDAEPTVSPDGKYMVFTSTRSGDLELWRYEFATQRYEQLTDELGYDGGAFFSPDSKQIVWRCSRPKGDAATSYKQLLEKELVQPTDMNIWVMNIDGSNKRQVTNLPGANWAPFFHPSGQKILFSSNHQTTGKPGRPRFNIFMINVDGTGLEQITFSKVFDAFPMFSPDGKKIAFSSNRMNHGSRDTNVFVADWVE